MTQITRIDSGFQKISRSKENAWIFTHIRTNAKGRPLSALFRSRKTTKKGTARPENIRRTPRPVCQLDESVPPVAAAPAPLRFPTGRLEEVTAADTVVSSVEF
ncbi:hypothetical protein GWI33_022383 [Rhynchophorus ferrugineus]|uniref:Uncharacterized protein n=1 Tax=Rhynchophorus ferrugineus TaxID=354439 RepID=A0A834MHN2_RHYFE|nr:hypothetical protein GWI33_022383 [Rhynchophorus ferrugineus]